MKNSSVITNNTSRNYSIDILRILCMFMIVILHTERHGGYLDVYPPLSIINFILHYINILCSVAVNVFFLISGYFLINEDFRLSKLLKVIIEVWFYSWLYLFFLFLFDKSSLSFSSIYALVFPLSFQEYWFMTAYVGMYLLSPIMNLLLRNISRKQHEVVVLLFVLMGSIWDFLVPYSNPFYFAHGYSLLWSLVLYAIASYIRLYISLTKITSRYLSSYICACTIGAVIWYLTILITSGNSIVNGHDISEYFFGYSQPLNLIASLSLFLAFIQHNGGGIKLPLKAIIKSLTPLMMGVYLIHDNNEGRTFFWRIIKDVFNLQGSFIEMFIVIVLLFLTCCLLDYVRYIFFGFLYKTKFYSEIIVSLEKQISRLYTKVSNMIETL